MCYQKVAFQASGAITSWKPAIIVPTFFSFWQLPSFSSSPCYLLLNEHWIHNDKPAPVPLWLFPPFENWKRWSLLAVDIADTEPLCEWEEHPEALWNKIFSEHFDGQTERKQLYIASLKTILFLIVFSNFIHSKLQTTQWEL